jgi:hypothetical protein
VAAEQFRKEKRKNKLKSFQKFQQFLELKSINDSKYFSLSCRMEPWLGSTAEVFAVFVIHTYFICFISLYNTW